MLMLNFLNSDGETAKRKYMTHVNESLCDVNTSKKKKKFPLHGIFYSALGEEDLVHFIRIDV